jgi:peptidyl-prolyl cis-trans isomerase A (cyclophilin A)
MKHSAFGNIAHRLGALMISTALLAAANANAQSEPLVKISTSMGDMVVELQSKFAPNTVAHFLRNVDEKAYDGTIFHKLVPNYVMQGGGFDQNFKERNVTVYLKHEGQEAAARGNIKNSTATLGMARKLTRDSASLEFFINLANNPDLDPVAVPDTDPVLRFEWGGKVYENVPRQRLLDAPELFGYTTFGKIVSGGELIEKFKSLKTGVAGPFNGDVPVDPLVINRIERLTSAMTVVTVASPSAPVVEKASVAAVIPVVNTVALPSAPVVEKASVAAVIPAVTTVALPSAPVVEKASIAAVIPAVTAVPAASASKVEDALRRWSTAWSSKDTATYIAAYVPEFIAAGNKNRTDWEAQRTARIKEKSKISLQLTDVDIKLMGETAVARFTQAYQADAVKSISAKTLTFSLRAGNWLIVKEESK